VAAVAVAEFETPKAAAHAEPKKKSRAKKASEK
jgi:hypothetical protein